MGDLTAGAQHRGAEPQATGTCSLPDAFRRRQCRAQSEGRAARRGMAVSTAACVISLGKEKTGKGCLSQRSPRHGMGSPPVHTLSDPQPQMGDKGPRHTSPEWSTSHAYAGAASPD